MVEVGNRVFIGKFMQQMRFEKTNVSSQKTYKSKSVSQSKGKRLRNPKHDTFMVEVGNRVFIWKFMQKLRC